jgi:RimJ/RimL family protein N-acetyltransferase
MFNTVKLTLAGQKAWFEKIKNDKSRFAGLYILRWRSVGSMYLNDIDYNNKRCESGWFVAETEYRSLKLAMALQQNMYDYGIRYAQAQQDIRLYFRR